MRLLTKRKNDIYYFCCLIEYIARMTNNHRSTIIGYFDNSDIQWQLRVACANSCLSIEQVSSELIDYFDIKGGNYIRDKDIDKVYNVETIGRLLQTGIVALIDSRKGIIHSIREVLETPINELYSEIE